MSRRLPSTPPTLPGFSYIRVLGSGGFADVFLYEQNMPRRLVAVKVLLAEVVNDRLRQMFQAEANLMAQLSSHPSILTVYQASVSADGRPYLVMEYCSAALGQRYRSEPLPVSEVLAIGIKIASAVETAHRAGVLHRDIKPSNILMTAYGYPVLSDFGIAATLGEAESSATVGLSIPWSAPEVLVDEVSGSVASEVWSLGATLWSLLAGRSPFEVVGRENTSAELMARIQRARLEPIERADVPASLERLLGRALSKRPADRQSSALELVRELQGVEAELGFAQTPLEVAMDDWAIATAVDPDDKTRITGAHAIDPGPPRRRRAPGQRRAGQTALSHSRSTAAQTPAAAEAPAAAIGTLLRADAGGIPTVSDVSGRVDGTTVTFTWNDPGLESEDSYLVSIDGNQAGAQRGTRFQVDATGRDRVCMSVTVVRAGKTGAPSAEKCVDSGGGASG